MVSAFGEACEWLDHRWDVWTERVLYDIRRMIVVPVGQSPVGEVRTCMLLYSSEKIYIYIATKLLVFNSS